MPRTTSSFLAVAVISALGCSGSGSSDPPCVPNLTPQCAATYAPPTYDTIFMNILQPNCATGTGTCHTPDFAAGGLVLADVDQAYAMLLGQNGNRQRVIPGNPGCSLLMKHLESTDPNYHMPKGPNSLSPGDLCTIVQWISQGASR